MDEDTVGVCIGIALAACIIFMIGMGVGSCAVDHLNHVESLEKQVEQGVGK